MSRPRPQFHAPAWCIAFSAVFWVALLCAVVLTGCSHLPRISLPGGAQVVGNRDAGTPAKLTSGEVKSGFRVPAKSRLTVTHTKAQPATADAPAQPEREVSVWEFAEPTAFEQVASTLSADTGTIDTTVARHRIDVAERRWLLWAAIGCGVAGVLALQLASAWPSLGRGLLAAAACAFAAWKLAAVPAWLWLALLGAVVLVILGYKRAEWDRNGNGIPDILERKP